MAKIKTIRSSWWEGYGYRLDCQPYLAGALETKIILESLKLRKDHIRNLTTGPEGGIYFAGRESVQWVGSPEYGIPFLRGRDIISADLSCLPLISKKQVSSNPLFLVRRGMTLITRSGTIGRTAYVRPEMDGMACSDALRVVPDPEKIPPGYLYAFLSSKFGIPLVASGTYGAIIQHLEPEHIADIPVPRLDPKTEREIHALVEKAAELRTTASSRLNNIKQVLKDHFQVPQQLSKKAQKKDCSVGSSSLLQGELSRLDPWFYNAKAMAADEWVGSHTSGYSELQEMASVYGVPPFKRWYVEGDEHGIGFFGSADIFKVDRTPEKYLSMAQTHGLEKYILERETILLASSGSLGGVIGRPQFTDSELAGQAASNHVVRVMAKKHKVMPGYLYAYLSLDEIGYPLILRTATGDAIPEIWPVYLGLIKILKAPRSLITEVHEVVVSAFEMRVQATKAESAAREILERTLEEARR